MVSKDMAVRLVSPTHTQAAFVSLCDCHYMAISEEHLSRCGIWSSETSTCHLALHIAHGRAMTVDVTKASSCVNHLGCRILILLPA